jgi:segregation and condensation protein A
VTAPFHVQQDAYQGPLDLLLALIEKRKLLINDISLAEVADDFIRYVEQHPEFPVSQTANFILTGSTLLLIKSKSLLPVLSLTSEEQESIEDLEQRLKLLEIYKRLAPVVQSTFGKTVLFERRPTYRRIVEFSPDASMNLSELQNAMERVLHNLPTLKQPIPETTVQKVMSLEEMVDRLTERMNSSLRTSFREFAGSHGDAKVHVVISFLAMLELVKQGILRVEQEGQFGDIVMESDKVGVPRYG